MTVLARPPQISVDSGSGATHLTRPSTRERLLVGLALFVYAWGTPPEWLVFARGGEVESSIVTVGALLLLFGHSVVSLNGNWHVALRVAQREPLIPMFVALAFVSTLWSAAVAATFQEGVVLTLTYVTALHLIVRFELREILSLAAWVFAIGAILNLGFILAFQDLGSFTLSISAGNDSFAWNGITAQKNSLGRAAALGYVVCAAHARVRRSYFLWPGFALLNTVLLLGSRSSTGAGAVIGITALSLVLLGFRGRKTLYGATMISMFAVFTTLTTLAATNLAAATGLLGKDSSFTGRAPLWQNSILHGVSERPLLGFGRRGFWGNGDADFAVQLRTNFDSPHAHNAWIDALLEVGPLGALLLTGIFVRGLFWSTRRIRAVPNVLGMFPAVIISMAFIFSTTETGFISRSLQFILFVVALTESAAQKGKKERFVGRHQRSASQTYRQGSEVPGFR